MNGRQRVEQAFELLAAVPADPELPGGRAEIKGRRLELVDRHRVPKDREVALPLRQPLRKPRPRVAAVFAAPDGRSAAWTGACRRLERHDVDGVRVVRMHDDRKTEARRQSVRDRSPGAPVVVAAKHADVRPRAAGAAPFRPSAMVLHVEPAGCRIVAGDLVHALPVLRIRIGLEPGADAGVRRVERLAAVFAQVVAPRRDAEMHALAVANDRVHAEAAGSRRPLARVLVVADARHHLPRVSAVVALEQRGGLDAGPQFLFRLARLNRPDVHERAALAPPPPFHPRWGARRAPALSCCKKNYWGAAPRPCFLPPGGKTPRPASPPPRRARFPPPPPQSTAQPPPRRTSAAVPADRG